MYIIYDRWWSSSPQRRSSVSPSRPWTWRHPPRLTPRWRRRRPSTRPSSSRWIMCIAAFWYFGTIVVTRQSVFSCFNPLVDFVVEKKKSSVLTPDPNFLLWDQPVILRVILSDFSIYIYIVQVIILLFHILHKIIRSFFYIYRSGEYLTVSYPSCDFSIFLYISFRWLFNCFISFMWFLDYCCV